MVWRNKLYFETYMKCCVGLSWNVWSRVEFVIFTVCTFGKRVFNIAQCWLPIEKKNLLWYLLMIFIFESLTLSILTQWRRKKLPKSGESSVCVSNIPVKLFRTENAVFSWPWVIKLKQRLIASEKSEANGCIRIKIKNSINH